MPYSRCSFVGCLVSFLLIAILNSCVLTFMVNVTFRHLFQLETLHSLLIGSIHNTSGLVFSVHPQPFACSLSRSAYALLGDD